ncbi:MAG TPA: hypothetical protein ACFE0H_10555 [Elainellaceae cyanobacterium]
MLRRLSKTLIWVAILTAFLIGLGVNGQHIAMAQDTGLSFRISRLESENTRLRARINQLETQVSRISRSSGVTLPAPVSPPATGLDDPAIASDPMFDRLATLVIETRQDVFALQDRLADLEQQLSSQFNLDLESRGDESE